MHDRIQIIETGMNGRRTLIDTVGGSDSISAFDAAKIRVTKMGVCHMENDAEYVDCADAYMTDGRVLAIQPEGFNLATAATYAGATTYAKKMQDAAAAFDKEFLK